MPNKKSLEKAFASKNDEFYTQLSDIEKELKCYHKHFKNKTVLCNCDDPRISNFFKYFSLNFEKLGLKKLITTCYKSQDMNNFSKYDSDKGLKLYYEGDKNNNRIPDDSEIDTIKLESDGDFRSDECIEILKQADIVCTNPPFSLFREYVAQLEKYKKKYIILGNINAISYKEIFPLIKENKTWLGSSIHSGDREFEIPNVITTSPSLRIDENGKKFVRVVGVRWFTNLDYQERHDDLFLFKKYDKDEYPKYDNYNAININKTKYIPINYNKKMGVPISFLDKYNPDQFEIIDAIGRYSLLQGSTKKTKGKYLTEINKKRVYARIVIKHKRKLK